MKYLLRDAWDIAMARYDKGRHYPETKVMKVLEQQGYTFTGQISWKSFVPTCVPTYKITNAEGLDIDPRKPRAGEQHSQYADDYYKAYTQAFGVPS